MLTIIFCIALAYVAIRMLIWGIKATWGIAKIIAFVVLLPALVIGLVIAGLYMLAFGLVILMSIVITIGGFLLA